MAHKKNKTWKTPNANNVIKSNGSIFKCPADNVIIQEWDEQNLGAAMKYIEEVLTMKVGKRCPANEIYWRVNDYCNTLPFNAEYKFLFNECMKQFKGIPNIEKIINTVLD